MNLTMLKYKIINDYFTEPIRPFSKELKKRKLVTGVEIGTAQGQNASNILRTVLSIEKLYCIDSYPSYIDGDGKKKDYSIFKEEAKKKLSRYGNRVEIIIEDSIVASSRFERESLDFVYLDGLHTERVYNEVEVYLDKIKAGGLLGGDDFTCEYPLMINAIVKFAKDNSLKLHGCNNDWWLE